MISVDDYQRQSRRLLPTALYECLASGSEDEQTLTENRDGFKGWFVRPRVMRPMSHISTYTTVRFLNTTTSPTILRIQFPLFVSPAGVHALCDPIHGECATARACAISGIPFCLSQHATRSIAEVAMCCRGLTVKQQPQWWYQAYI